MVDKPENNHEVIDRLIEKLQNYKTEARMDNYEMETVIKDVIYFTGLAFDEEKFYAAPGFSEFCRIVSEATKHDVARHPITHSV